MVIRDNKTTFTMKECLHRAINEIERNTKNTGNYTETAQNHIKRMRATINQAETKNTD